MQSLGAQAWIWAAAFLTAGIAVVGAFLAPATFWSRLVRFRWWFAGLGVLVLAWVFLVVLRRQYPPEPKVTSKNFGHNRRLPITTRWREK